MSSSKAIERTSMIKAHLSTKSPSKPVPDEVSSPPLPCINMYQIAERITTHSIAGSNV
jgi:hypothetical protein